MATFVLVWIGGMVTSRGVGMSVPDWPNSYGYNMFFFPPSKWVGGILFEHTHRLVASTVGFLTMVLALWMFGRSARPVIRWGGLLFAVIGMVCCKFFPTHTPENISLILFGLFGFAASYIWPKCEASPKYLRVLGVIAFVAVVVQGVLGGLRVVEVKDEIGIFHAVLAQLFLLLMASIALLLTRFWREMPQTDNKNLGNKFLVTTCLIVFQLGFGATMRHQHAGLAIPDFPTAYGRLWPDMSQAAVAHYNQLRSEVVAENPITGAQIVLQMMHRLYAAIILWCVCFTAWKTRRELGSSHWLSRCALVWVGLVFMQILLGASVIWTGKTADVATAHLACGALCLVVGGLGSLVAYRFPACRTAQSPVQKNELTSMLASSSMPR